MKKILSVLLATFLFTGIAHAVNINQIEGFGYTIGSAVPGNIKPVDEENAVDTTKSNDFYFTPLSNELNIDFEEYHMISSNNGTKIAGISAYKYYSTAEECESVLKKSKPVLLNKYKIATTNTHNLIIFNPDSVLTSVSLSCASENLIYQLVDQRLTLKQ